VVGVDPAGDADRLLELHRAGADKVVRGLGDLIEHAT
jgi:hypothetical protein